MSNKMKNSSVVIVLMVIIAGGFLFRSWFSEKIMPPPSRMQGETTQSYRYAKMISEGKRIPAVDTMVMHPEGMSTSENSIFEEYIAGGLHQITGGDFNSFLRFFCLFFPLLTIPFLYLWMRSVSFDVPYALAGSALYAILLPALLRTRGESFYRETVALPLIILLAWLTENSMSSAKTAVSKSRISGIAAGAVLFLALATWKVTVFFTFFLFLYLIWKEHRTGRIPYHLKLPLALAQILASLLLSHMKHDSAWISPATVMAVFLIVPAMKNRWFAWIATSAAFLSVLAVSGSTGHVGAVIMAKLRFMFTHPSDPSLLSGDARLFWVSGYTSPTPAQFFFLFGIPIAVALPGLPAFLKKSRGTLLYWFLPLSLAGYLFFDRLHVLFAVALIPVIAESFRKNWAIIPVLALIIVQVVFPAHIAELVASTGLEYRNTASLLDENELNSMLSWIQRETDPDEAILSFWHISGLISAYAERPVVTHTFFENQNNRKTILEFSRIMFETEENLLAFMSKKKCNLVVYQADFLLDSSFAGLLYLAGLSEIPFNAVALEMHYSPDSLDSLFLVFQGPSLRIFRKGGGIDVSERHFLFEERYSHCYRSYDEARAILADPRAASGYMADTGLEMNDPDMLSAAFLLGVSCGGPQEVTQHMLNDLILLYIQGSYKLDYLAEDIDTFIYWCGFRAELKLLMARLYVSEGRYPEAKIEYETLLEENPGNTEASEELEVLLNEMNR